MGQVVGFCAHSNEISGCVKGEYFLEQMRDSSVEAVCSAVLCTELKK
jgi:hypothetical protein